MKKLLGCLLMVFLFASVSEVQAQSYDNAIGARLGWGFAGSFKHFLTEDLAGEGIVNFKTNYFSVTALVQKHKPIAEVENLSWYFGGGAFLGFYSGVLSNSSSLSLGIAGNLGLDYAFKDIPLNISLDWIPSLSLTGGYGFGPESGGIAARYIIN